MPSPPWLQGCSSDPVVREGLWQLGSLEGPVCFVSLIPLSSSRRHFPSGGGRGVRTCPRHSWCCSLNPLSLVCVSLLEFCRFSLAQNQLSSH